MCKRLSALIFAAAIWIVCLLSSSGSSSQEKPSTLTSNTCVACHSHVSKPLELSVRYLEWDISAHKTAAVGCEKCHGGDSASSDARKAHQKVLPPSNMDSRLNEVKLPETCGSCHRAILDSFAESTHYQKLKSTGLGPSCITCHGHMPSSVVKSSAEIETICSLCHNAVNGLLPQRPEIQRKARQALEAMARDDYITTEITTLIKESQDRKIDVENEAADAKAVKIQTGEAKVAWHAFNLDTTLNKATKTFELGLSIRDRLNKRLGR